jgi:4a-hydroxytetrahydrobiopterin dehydratase
MDSASAFNCGVGFCSMQMIRRMPGRHSRLAGDAVWLDNRGDAGKIGEKFAEAEMKAQKLEAAQIAAKLKKLSGWSMKEGNLHRTFKFADFNAAFGFMCRAALIAEAMNHHPDWSNVWNKVTVNLSTHSIGGISQLDFELAEKMQKLL